MKIFKYKRINIMVAFVIIVLVSFVLYQRAHLKIINDGVLTLEVGQEISDQLEDYFHLTYFLPFERKNMSKDFDITLNEQKYIDTEQNLLDVGEYTGQMTYKEKTYKLKLIVEDTTAPTIECKDIPLSQKDFQIDDYIVVTDNSTQECAVEIDQRKLTIEKIGEYLVYVEATDNYSNKTQKEITLKVTDQTAPALKNVSETRIVLNQSFDPLVNVQAVDNVDGDCTSNIQVDGQVNTKKIGEYTLTYSVVDKAGNRAKTERKVYVLNSSQKIKDIPMILQNPGYYNGCETASATMLLQYYQYDISMKQMVNKVPTISLENHNDKLYGADPQEAFTGSMSGEGYGIYVKAMTKTIQKYLDQNGKKHQVQNITGASFNQLLSYLDQGYPVQVWATVSMNDASTSRIKTWYIKTLSGEYTNQKVSFPYSEHSLVLIGYDQDYVFFNNPLEGVVKYRYQDFQKAYQSMGSQALIIKSKDKSSS